jgi:hypothetical protein
MHSFGFSLENCGKYLAKSGKLARIHGLNIVNSTYWRTPPTSRPGEDGRDK